MSTESTSSDIAAEIVSQTTSLSAQPVEHALQPHIQTRRDQRCLYPRWKGNRQVLGYQQRFISSCCILLYSTTFRFRASSNASPSPSTHSGSPLPRTTNQRSITALSYSPMRQSLRTASSRNLQPAVRCRAIKVKLVSPRNISSDLNGIMPGWQPLLRAYYKSNQCRTTLRANFGK